MADLRLPVLLATLPAAFACKPALDVDLLSHLPRGEDQRRALCARNHDDAVSNAFCGERAPDVSSLADVQRLLGFTLEGGAISGFSLIGHSSALPTRSVSSINPGSVIVSLPTGQPPDGAPLNGDPGPRRDDGNIVALAYARGDQVVELAVMPRSRSPRFYLLRYEQACNDDVVDDEHPSPHGACTSADLLTERTEQGWTGWSLYDDDDLKNSAFDCLHCHQPDGPGTQRIFRLQEVTDAQKLADMTGALVAFRNGDTDELPDIRDVFLEAALPGMSHRPKPGLDGKGILVHACAQCHNPRLPDDISRARFDVMNLDRMSRSEKDLAIERMKLAKDDRFLMPPKLFRELSDDEIERAIAELER